MKRWPLFLIALPAAVAVWSGWVGLGGMCGFGLVQPFPGILPWHLNTAITLPVGVESYGAYALGAWLTPGTPERARAFARRSAIGALALGMLGQVVYHLLAAAHAARAPWPVTVLVACLPVVTLGFGAALAHLLRDANASALGTERQVSGDPVMQMHQPDLAPEVTAPGAPTEASGPAITVASLNGTSKAVLAAFGPDIEAARVPGIRRIQGALHVGAPKARTVQEAIRNTIAERDQ